MKKILLTICILAGVNLAHAQTDAALASSSGKAAVLTNQLQEKSTVSDAFPNPAQDQISFEYTLSPSVREAKVTIYNVLGAAVLNQDLDRTSSKQTLALDKLTPGVYFYSVAINGNNQFTKRLVIKR
jgi:hypothetical protein